MSSQESQPFQWHYTQLNDNDFQIKGRTLFFLIVLFSIVLLVTIFFLYARWVCRFNHFTTYHARHARHAPPPRPPGLDNTTINALPITLHNQHHNQSKNNSESNSECCICLGVFEDGDKVKVLPRCHHCYHCECVDRWLMTHSSCPLCRASLRVDSVVVAAIV